MAETTINYYPLPTLTVRILSIFFLQIFWCSYVLRLNATQAARLISEFNNRLRRVQWSDVPTYANGDILFYSSRYSIFLNSHWKFRRSWPIVSFLLIEVNRIHSFNSKIFVKMDIYCFVCWRNFLYLEMDFYRATCGHLYCEKHIDRWVSIWDSFCNAIYYNVSVGNIVSAIIESALLRNWISSEHWQIS